MKKTYYLFNPGRLSRKDNTLKFQFFDEDGNEKQARYIPIETIDNLYCFGSLDANSALYNFLGKNNITVHFFDYYEHYTGSFLPKDYLLSGKVIVAQVKNYIDKNKRLKIAQKIVDAAAFNLEKNLKYYKNRDKISEDYLKQIEQLHSKVFLSTSIDELMGIEGNIRNIYYSSFNEILNEFEFDVRTKRPPKNEVNAMISFLNMICYTLCIDMIYHTQLNPTISFLHEPGERRFSLALDLSEIFKPILVDRLIFSLINKKQVQIDDFDNKLNYCVIKDKAKKTIVQSWDEKLSTTIKHRSLNRNVSYKNLVKLECYKLVKHIMNLEEYKPFKAWW
ncbi:MAG: type I-B CRISPR-associated endonuclease Cas1b [Bacteroidales bacterium]|jgi:CRISPR-associated protein Cas1|nr:type I-B CRISPR-associated endonuclease Cas1b [Bacteroidales bacterium]HOL97690.1 type I-B CRISPR-associated endonuclease Cas1b [Bacteroidales bacterium]HRT00359.1 type I-B CRISPR-associated endonuclease Cas1b [Bacteroidales bacterium]HUM32531.1 type I-B CRISPR-associated endonuclease Cas1b [Bacteroidales bacterium]